MLMDDGSDENSTPFRDLVQKTSALFVNADLGVVRAVIIWSGRAKGGNGLQCISFVFNLQEGY